MLYGKSVNELSYDNPIVALENVPYLDEGFNIIFKDGSHGSVVWREECKQAGIITTIIPDHSIFSQVDLLFSKVTRYQYGLYFFNRKGELVYKVGNTWKDDDIIASSIILQPTDRLVGAKSKFEFPGVCALCSDFQFIIGRRIEWDKNIFKKSFQ